jgi:hypothetical protein
MMTSDRTPHFIISRISVSVMTNKFIHFSGLNIAVGNETVKERSSVKI